MVLESAKLLERTSEMTQLQAAGVRSRAVDVPERAPASQGTRIAALDFTKGSLVLLMVLYHWLNYFVDVPWDVYRYLRFLTPSFIFITGFIITSVYLARYAPDDPRVRRRLISRGLKLLVLFTALNGLAALLARPSPAGAANPFGAALYSIYVTGNGRAAFDVLVPIAYLLIVSPFVLRASARFPWAPHAIAAVTLTAAWALGRKGFSSVTLELLAIGLLGLSIGTVSRQVVRGAAARVGWLLVAYAGYLIAISAWNIVFPLQVIGVCLSVLLIYVAGATSLSAGPAGRCVVELGQYSLFAYLAQIVVLQLLRRGFRDLALPGAPLAALVTATILTIAAVDVVATARARSTGADRLYRAVFA